MLRHFELVQTKSTAVGSAWQSIGNLNKNDSTKYVKCVIILVNMSLGSKHNSIAINTAVENGF